MDLYLVPDTSTSITFFLRIRFIVFMKQEYCLSEWHLDAIHVSILSM